MYITPEDKKKYDTIFNHLIFRYNKVGEIHEHFVKLDKDRVMYIFFTTRWKYNVYELENYK